MDMAKNTDSFNPASVDGEIAVLIPCYNEEVTIGKVVDDFAEALPSATIYVYDNNSTDATARIAKEHGAIVCYEQRQGKGNVVRQMLREVEADYYIMVDGDDTYPASASYALLEPLVNDRADMVVGDRISNGAYEQENKRAFHGFGNGLVSWLIHALYGFKLRDAMSGMRAFNQVFAKTMPVTTQGFEIETELSIHAVDKGWRIEEVPIAYRDRPEGSESKLSTVKDGYKVLKTIASLFKDYRPMALFGWLFLILFLIGLVLAIPIIMDFYRTGLVERFPTFTVAIALIGAAFLLTSVWTQNSSLESMQRNCAGLMQLHLQ